MGGQTVLSPGRYSLWCKLVFLAKSASSAFTACASSSFFNSKNPEILVEWSKHCRPGAGNAPGCLLVHSCQWPTSMRSNKAGRPRTGETKSLDLLRKKELIAQAAHGRRAFFTLDLARVPLRRRGKVRPGAASYRGAKGMLLKIFRPKAGAARCWPCMKFAGVPWRRRWWRWAARCWHSSW